MYLPILYFSIFSTMPSLGTTGVENSTTPDPPHPVTLSSFFCTFPAPPSLAISSFGLQARRACALRNISRGLQAAKKRTYTATDPTEQQGLQTQRPHLMDLVRHQRHFLDVSYLCVSIKEVVQFRRKIK